MNLLSRRFLSSLPPLKPRQLPSPTEIHLCYMDPGVLSCETLIDQYEEILAPFEKEVVFGFRRSKKRKAALLGCVLTRSTIAKYMANCQPPVSPTLLEFTKNAYGKTEVHWPGNDQGRPPLQFTTACRSSLIACAVTTSRPIGMDVENKNRVAKAGVSLVAKDVFSDHEFQFLSLIEDPTIQQREYNKLCTLKVAYLKALGKGSSAAALNSFTITSRCHSNRSFPVLNDPGSKVRNAC